MCESCNDRVRTRPYRDLGESAAFKPRALAVLAKADVQVAALEQTLVLQRAELNKSKAAAKSSAGQPSYKYSRVANELTTLVGDYRDLKQSRDPKYYQDMVGHYNDAISDANNLVPSAR